MGKTPPKHWNAPLFPCSCLRIPDFSASLVGGIYSNERQHLRHRHWAHLYNTRYFPCVLSGSSHFCLLFFHHCCVWCQRLHWATTEGFKYFFSINIINSEQEKIGEAAPWHLAGKNSAPSSFSQFPMPHPRRQGANTKTRWPKGYWVFQSACPWMKQGHKGSTIK